MREVEKIAASICRYEPDQVAVAVAENHWEQDQQPEPSTDGKPPRRSPTRGRFLTNSCGCQGSSPRSWTTASRLLRTRTW